MRFLVTGGAGFIGSHLVEHFLDRGDEVVVLDNLSTGRLDNIEHLAGRPHFTYVIGNVLDYNALERHVAKCDTIVHLAAAVGVRLIMEEPVETVATNVHGTENVLNLANRYRKKVLLASSSEVYGKSVRRAGGREALREDDDSILGPSSKRRWAYACSKAIGEFLARAYYEEKKLPVVIARLFNTVGPRQTGRYGMVVPTFVQAALRDDPIVVFGSGEQTRCFIHVVDAVRAMAALLDTPSAEGEVFNIGRAREISINQLASRIKSLVGSGSEIRHVSYVEAFGPGYEDMERRTPDISKLQSVVDFNPRYGMDDILRDVIAHLKQ